MDKNLIFTLIITLYIVGVSLTMSIVFFVQPLIGWSYASVVNLWVSLFIGYNFGVFIIEMLHNPTTN